MKSNSANIINDNLGRYILDLDTPAEKSFGRVFGCFTRLTAVIAFFMAFAILGAEMGIITKLLRIFGLVSLVYIFNYFRSQIDCYYVLDVVGGQFLYHFSALMMVSEDPVANIEDIAGIGVTYSGNEKYAIVLCLIDGKIIRVSDYSNRYFELNATVEAFADILKVPCHCAETDGKKIIAVENGVMVSQDAGLVTLSFFANNLSGCLMHFILFPYYFGPALIVMTVSLVIISGDTGSVEDTNSLIKQNNYRAIDINGKEVFHRPSPRTKASVAETSESVKKDQTKQQTDHQNKEVFSIAPDSNASGTISPGRGIIGLIEINEDMMQVYERFGKEFPVLKAESTVPPAQNQQKKYSRYVPPVTHRDDFFNNALSVVFQENKSKQMKVHRIEITLENENLPYRTADGIGQGASAKKLFDLGDGQGNLARNEGQEVGRRIPDAYFYQFYGHKNGYGIGFMKRGISFEFVGDALYRIVIEPQRK